MAKQGVALMAELLARVVQAPDVLRVVFSVLRDAVVILAQRVGRVVREVQVQQVDRARQELMAAWAITFRERLVVMVVQGLVAAVVAVVDKAVDNKKMVRMITVVQAAVVVVAVLVVVVALVAQVEVALLQCFYIITEQEEV